MTMPPDVLARIEAVRSLVEEVLPRVERTERVHGVAAAKAELHECVRAVDLIVREGLEREGGPIEPPPRTAEELAEEAALEREIAERQARLAAMRRGRP
jgi:hypothetical protein